MFEPKSFEKLAPTSLEVYKNRLRLEELSVFDPFELSDLDGLTVLSYPDFEVFYKVVNSLRVSDDEGRYMVRQTEYLKRDIVKTAKQETFLELLYNVKTPDEALYRETLKERLMINLVNLVLDPEVPTDRPLNGPEIFQVKETFKEMLDNS